MTTSDHTTAERPAAEPPRGAMTAYVLRDLIDLDTYPLDEPRSEAYQAVVQQAQAGLRSVGCAVIRDLVRADAVARINAEIVDRKHTTHFSVEVMNPYFHTTHNPDFGDHHPVNTRLSGQSIV